MLGQAPALRWPWLSQPAGGQGVVPLGPEISLAPASPEAVWLGSGQETGPGSAAAAGSWSEAQWSYPSLEPSASGSSDRATPSPEEEASWSSEWSALGTPMTQVIAAHSSQGQLLAQVGAANLAQVLLGCQEVGLRDRRHCLAFEELPGTWNRTEAVTHSPAPTTNHCLPGSSPCPLAAHTCIYHPSPHPISQICALIPLAG